MTIKQALKYKNKLVKKIGEAFKKVYTYNTVLSGQTRPYDVVDSMNEYFKLSQELVELKTKIHKANQPVYDKIFLLSELKSQATKLDVLDCSEGEVSDRYHDKTQVKTSVISIVERDKIIANLEEQIESIQEELDIHNSTTQI